MKGCAEQVKERVNIDGLLVLDHVLDNKILSGKYCSMILTMAVKVQRVLPNTSTLEHQNKCLSPESRGSHVWTTISKQSGNTIQSERTPPLHEREDC